MNIMNNRFILHLVIMFHTFLKICKVYVPVLTFGCNLPSLVPSLWNCQSENVGVLKFLFLLVVEDQKDQTCLSNT